MEPTQGHIESDSKARRDLYLALQELERRGTSNEDIARLIIESTPNHRQIAEIILTLKAKGDIVKGKLKWRK